MSETPNIRVGDVYGLYLDSGWNYIEVPNTICVVRQRKVSFKDVIVSLNHEYLHYVFTKLFSKEASFKANYGLDYLAFVEHKLKPDLM